MTPVRVFLCCALVFGTAFALLTPPLDAPDEVRHLQRAYLVSEGQLSVPGRAPGHVATVPRSLARLHSAQPHRTRRSPAPWHHRPREVAAQLRKPLEPDERSEVERLSIYSPVVYAPQAAAIRLGRHLRLAPVALLYAGRLADLMAWAVLTALAIRLAPLRRWSLVLLSLTPMSVFQAGSLSADNVTHALALLVLALALRLAFKPGMRVDARHTTALLATCGLLGLTKPGYGLLAAVVLAIPASRFGSRRERWLLVAAVAATTLIPSLLWQWSVELAQPTPARAFPAAPPADPMAQLELVLVHPLTFLGRVATTLVKDGWIYLREFIGYLGGLEVMLPEPVYVLYPIALVGSALFDGSDPAELSRARRSALAGLFVLGTICVLLLAYLGWNAPGSTRILGIQGRYFAPFAPLLLVALPSRWSLSPRAAGWIAALFCYATLAAALNVTWRYYWG